MLFASLAFLGFLVAATLALLVVTRRSRGEAQVTIQAFTEARSGLQTAVSGVRSDAQGLHRRLADFHRIGIDPPRR